jgi:hypothetical protein
MPDASRVNEEGGTNANVIQVHKRYIRPLEQVRQAILPRLYHFKKKWGNAF